MRQLLLGGLVVVLLGGSACAPCSQGRGFEVSLARDTGGQTSALAAAKWFAVHGGVWSDLPTSGWRVTGESSQGVNVQSGTVTVQAIQGADGTWFVVSGTDTAC